MGNTKGKEQKEFAVKINHPRLQQSKIITLQEDKHLQTTLTIHEKEYNKWKALLSKVEKPPHNLFLPVKHTFSRTAMCGHTGNAIVPFSS